MPPKARGRGRGRGVLPGSQELPPVGRAPPEYQQQDVYPTFQPREQPPPQRQEPPPQRQEPPPQRQEPPPQRQEPPPQRQEPPPQRQPQEQPLSPPRKSKPQQVNPEDVGIQFQKLELATSLPRRPGVGQMGRKIRLVTNNFPIEIPSGFVYHYDVEIVSKGRVTEQAAGTKLAVTADKKYRCMSTKRNREVVNEMLKGDNALRGFYPAYDGRKNLYTRRPLKFAGATLKLRVAMYDDKIPEARKGDGKGEGPKPDVFEVIIQPVKKKDTGTCAISLDPLHDLFQGRATSVPQDVIMAMETVLRSGPCLKFTPVGRSFFHAPKPEELHPLGGGREIWFGHHQSVRLGQWKPMVNINVTATTFYEHREVLKYVCELLKQTREGLKRHPALTDSQIIKLTKELKNLWIEVTHLKYPRKYKVLKVTRESANRLEFPLTVDGKAVKKKVSVYFLEQHNKKLEFPHLPCLQVGPEAKKVFLPIEVCKIKAGQHCKKKLMERQSAEMIKFTAIPPAKRFDEIRHIMKDDCKFNEDPHVKEFGFKVVCEPLKLEGRVLNPPNVRYDREQKIMPKDGSWDMRNVRFLKGAEIRAWVLISFSNERFCEYQHLEKFAGMLCKIGREVGINLDRPCSIEILDQRMEVRVVLERLKNKFNADLIVIVIPGQNKGIYNDAKQAAETILGLATQCVKDDNVVKKCSPPLVSNLCQKINAKMGGVNNGLTPGETPPILRRPVIIIGADVTHPSPSNDIKPSIAAAVGSLDSYPSRYAVTCRAQTNVDQTKNAIEIILDLKNMVVDLLKAFYRNTNGKKPEKIIFFRDGVSEGQFDKVRDHEVRCIREACYTLNEDYQPGITFVVVQKRHHTRFLPQDRRDGSGRHGNVPPGTTIDTTVTHPLNFDFFLCSHFGLQGTSRPAHYTLIEDDNDFSADDLQKLIFYLCHTYVRCTKSISIPAPVAYAHLAAFRARQHLLSVYDESSESSDISAAYQPLPQNIIDAIKVKDNLYNTMYFV